jgi:hypothetical protein
MWACGGVRLNEVINVTSLDLVVAHGPAVFGPAGSSPIRANAAFSSRSWAALLIRDA